MTIPSGKKLGRYETRSQIGAGGMGEVYLAEETKLDRKVALKIDHNAWDPAYARVDLIEWMLKQRRR